MAKLLTKAEVVERTQQLDALLGREHELQDQLLQLRLSGDREHVMRAREQHDQMIAEIQRLRMEEMLPIVAELNQFILDAKAHLGRKD